MPDGRHHRRRAGSDSHRHVVVVETGQVGFASAAPQDQDGVEVLPGGLLHPGDPIQGGDDRGRCAVSLHGGFEKDRVEGKTVCIALQMPQEVLQAGRGGRRDDGEVVRERRDAEFLLHIHIALLGELFDGALALQSLFAEGEGGVDVFYIERDTVQFTEIDLDLHQDGDAGTKRFAGRFPEEGGELRVFPFPDDGAGFGDAAAAARLGKGQVAMPVCIGCALADFRLHPVPPRERLRDHFLHSREQFGQFQVFSFHSFLFKLLKSTNLFPHPQIFPPCRPPGLRSGRRFCRAKGRRRG